MPDDEAARHPQAMLASLDAEPLLGEIAAALGATTPRPNRRG